MPLITIHRNVIDFETTEDDSENIQLILLYFDKKNGPRVFLTQPAEINPKVQDILVELFDLSLPLGFFEYTIIEENLTLGNFTFEIDSEWARGKRELLMLSAVIRNPLKINQFRSFFMQIYDVFRTTPNLFKAFYLESDNKEIDLEVQEKSRFLNDHLLHAWIFLKFYLNSIEMGRVLVLGTQGSGKTTLMNCISKDPLTKITQYSPQKTISINLTKAKNFLGWLPPSTILNPGKHILDFFLEQVEFWLYDLEDQIINVDSWLTKFENPIGIIYLFDLSSSAEIQKESIRNFKKVLIYYSSEYSETLIHPKMPILILVNKKDIVKTIDPTQVLQQLELDRFTYNVHIDQVSTSRNEGIEAAMKWFLSQLILL